MTQYLPIIYVRGFAGGQGGIDTAVEDPFYGFNEGSTHVRVGSQGTVRFHQFESPLLRLMMDFEYELRVAGDQQRLLEEAQPDSLPARTIWIYRFYDANASTFGHPAAAYRIEDAAEGLTFYINHVLDKTRDADQVYLIAHSMGGLICRSAIQRYMYRAHQSPTPVQVEQGHGSAPNPANTAPVESTGKLASRFPVSKVVTYGTPHGGIDIELGGPIGNWIIDAIGPSGSDIFAERRMREYLTPEGQSLDSLADWDPRQPYFSRLPAERYLSLVGTNAKDYDAANGWSARAVGVKSDGLVQIRNAYVKGSNRAYIHRAHSGRYGLVNSEEGYQNLQRFLFGNLKVALSLNNLALDCSDGAIWQADVSLAIRGVPVLMHHQSARAHCPVILNEDGEGPLRPVPLVTSFLLAHEDKSEDLPRRYALDLRVFALREERGFLSFGSHLEQIADWQDTLLVDVLTAEESMIADATYQWNSTLSGTIAGAQLSESLSWQHAPDHTPDSPSWAARIDFPPFGRKVLGDQAHLALGVAAWE